MEDPGEGKGGGGRAEGLKKLYINVYLQYMTENHNLKCLPVAVSISLFLVLDGNKHLKKLCTMS